MRVCVDGFEIPSWEDLKDREVWSMLGRNNDGSERATICQTPSVMFSVVCVADIRCLYMYVRAPVPRHHVSTVLV